MTGVDRWGMTLSFPQFGYDCTFGDLMFSLGITIPVHTIKSVRLLAAIILPIFGCFPFAWVYPTGEKQEVRKPKYPRWFQWATVIAGDCHYIKCICQMTCEER